MAETTRTGPQITDRVTAMNAICPYYTMFPLAFPLRVLRTRAKASDWVLDPFCGRGTTNFAARALGLRSVGSDSSPIAVALTQAKLACARTQDVVGIARRILQDPDVKAGVPQGEFWEMAYDPTVLSDICKLRAALLKDCKSNARKVLRAILMGALHGPLTKTAPSHLSNQCPRTFSPKPNYAVRFWKERGLKAPKVDILAVVRRRAERYLDEQPEPVDAEVHCGSSSQKGCFGRRKFRWIITSPPYYGMRTYIPDHWLRNWFVGGPAHVDYSPAEGELTHRSPAKFVDDLAAVWRNVASAARDDATLVVRFGGIRDRNADPLDLIRKSLKAGGWRLTTVRPAGDALDGKRQAKQFRRVKSAPMAEYDLYACKDD